MDKSNSLGRELTVYIFLGRESLYPFIELQTEGYN